VARRFRAEAEATFARLAKSPGIAPRYDPDHPALAEVRYQTVSRFKACVVFHRPTADGIEVLRVLHGARDIAGILAEDLGIDADAGDG
jgi:toxin ParE1/3/4